MEIIKKLSKHIDSEIEDSINYAKAALKYKEDNKSLANTFYNLSVDELKHATMLHSEVVKLIEEYKKTNGEPPVGMLAIYNYIHEEEIEKTQKAKNYQQMFHE
jgi:ferritin